MTTPPETTLGAFVPFLKALSNPIRAQIVEFLLSGERCVCEMTGSLDVSQPLVSHHLALLRDAGLVLQRSEGTRTYYSIAWARFDGDLQGFLAAVAELRASSGRDGAASAACLAAEPRQQRPGLICNEKENTVRIKILGSGCANCQKLYLLAAEAADELGVADAELVKVEDFPTIMSYGVMTTPALVIDGVVVLSGKVPPKAEVVALLREAGTAR
jgi:small redox-active disulfide protein 2